MKYIRPYLIGTLTAALLIIFCACGSHTASMPAVSPAAPYTSTVSTPEPNPSPAVDLLILVNYRTPIAEDYTVELTKLDNGQSVATICYDALAEMLCDCSAAGYHPDVISGFRNIALQTQLYENKINRLMSSGIDRKEAEVFAATEVAFPGTSEHHTGLAVDIVDSGNYNLDESQEKTPTQQWLLQNSWRYGFILRYPKNKSESTGIIYEPWHYRYVGTDAAKIIYEENICLEEYLGHY